MESSNVQNIVGKEYVCQTCGKEFLGKRRLHNHMISKHPKGQKFVSCEYCGQVSLSIRDCMIKKWIKKNVSQLCCSELCLATAIHISTFLKLF